MDKEYIRQHLPTTPPEGLIEWAKETQHRELGGDFMVWGCERIPVSPTLDYIIEHQSINPKMQWSAVCSCSACGGDMVTSKVPGAEGIRFLQGEDGVLYDMPPGSERLIGEHYGIYDVYEGERFTCPCCLSEVELIHRKNLTGGHTKQIMLVALQIVEGCLTLIYWLVRRTIDEFGLINFGANPADAFVLDEFGKIHRFSHILRGGAFGRDRFRDEWQYCKNNADTISKPDHDWRSIMNRQAGADLFPEIPNLAGSTGEKTGIEDYLAHDGWFPVEYLKLWMRYPAVENICRTPHGGLIADIVNESIEYCYDVGTEAEKWLDLTEVKPNRMIGIPKADLRKLTQAGHRLTLSTIQSWRRYQEAGGALDITSFLFACLEFGSEGTSSLLRLMERYQDCDVPKIVRYLAGQHMSLRELYYLEDTRDMACQLAEGRVLYSEDLWPRNLAAAHERCTRMLEERAEEARVAQAAAQAEKVTRIDAKFAEIKDRLADLAWNDGDLCIVIPERSADLRREGNVLRHCVGSYSEAHAEMRDVIFFVRKYRRPERCYYTLDIDMTGVPKERQLHGYGNERHGLHKEYRHTIPKKVRLFCDRWKQEVLMPWFENQRKQEVKST